MSASLTKSFFMPIFVKAWEPKLIASILGSLFSSLVTSIFLWFFVLFPHFDCMTHSFFREMKITQSQRMKVAWRKLCHFFSETLFSISDLFKLFLFLKTSNMKYSLKNVIIARYLIKSKNAWKLFVFIAGKMAKLTRFCAEKWISICPSFYR